MTVLTKANRQWESRPADERFGSLKAMHDAAMGFKTTARVEEIKAKALRAAASGDNLILQADGLGDAVMNNWAFSQLANRASAPTAYLKTLPAPLAADCLNVGLERE